MFVKQKSILIAVILAAFMFIGIIGQSHAASITSLSTSSYHGSIYASLTTDEDIYVIDWYIDNTKIKTTDHYQSPTRSVYVYLGYQNGGIKGVNYKVKAVAWFSDEENNTFISDTETDKVRVFQSKVISGTKYPRGIPDHKRGDGIYGSVTLSRHYHDGSSIVVDGSVYALNGTKTTLHASEFYRHTRFNENDETIWSVEDPRLGKSLPPGETYSNSGSSMISFGVGGNIGREQEFILNAHIHLAVGGRVWHEENGAWTHTFDYKDNESYHEDDQ